VITAFKDGLRFLRRDLAVREMRVLLAALVVAVAAMSTVGLFTDRIRQVIDLQASELLGADLVIASAWPIEERFADQAEALGLQSSRSLEFTSALLIGDEPQLAQVKAVSSGYPLRGQLRVADEPFGPERAVTKDPPPGEVWLEPRLFTALGLDRGDVITLGVAQFRVGQVLTYEPDRGGSLFQFAPRVLMNRADVESTALVGPNSRVRHRLLIAGDPDAIARFRSWARGELGTGQQLQGLEDARPEMRVAIERSRQFLALASLVAVLISGVAIAVAVRAFANREADTVAVLRCIGATQDRIFGLFLGRVLAVGLVASLLGVAVGWAAQAGLAVMLSGLFAASLPLPGWEPAIGAVLAGLLVLLGFGLPPVIRLRRVPPMRVIRRDLDAVPPRAWMVLAVALGATLLVLLWQVRDLKLTLVALGGTLASLALLALGAALLVRLTRSARERTGVEWRFGIASLSRHRSTTLVLVTGFGVGIMALLLLAIVRTDLLDLWRDRLPERAPNQFLVNIQPGEVDALRAFLAERAVEVPKLFPVVRSRLVAINDRAVSPEDYRDERAKRMAVHDFNLSWSAEQPPGNRIVAGRYWPDAPADTGQFSVEEGIAETLSIQMGDRLTFNAAGLEVTARVTSLRTVEWDSFRVNFFVLSPPGLMADFPATYITSFYLPEERSRLLADLVRAFPSVTVLDVQALMRQVRGLMDRATLAVEYVFVFTLLAGLVVLYASVQSGRVERTRETAVLRALGATRRQVLRAIGAEFVVLGLLSGVLAAVAATAVGFALAELVFEFSYRPDAWVWVAGMLGGAAGIGLAGIIVTLPILRRPPWLTLRQL
jgi:putative ABC transport system permease protein